MGFLFIISAAIAFLYYILGEQVAYWYRHVIALIWIIGCFGPIILINKKIKGRDAFYIQTYVYPILLVALWTLIVWCINPNLEVNKSYFTRMIGCIIYISTPILLAMVGARLFGKKIIKYSVIAMAISVGINFICTIKMYGMGVFIQYLPYAMTSTDLPYGSLLWNFASALEVQDVTMATGFYLIYFIFIDDEEPMKERILYIGLLFICEILGFKRTQLLALLLASSVVIVAKKCPISLRYIIKIIGVIILIISCIYIVIVKIDLFSYIVKELKVDVTGRNVIYDELKNYYELSPFFIGNGFTYVDKRMFDTTGFCTHSIIIRLYAELGCIPFIIWMYWYLIGVPKKIYRTFGKKVGLVAMGCTLYIIITYFMENTLNLFCMQYSFVVITIAISKFTNERKHDIVSTSKNCSLRSENN